ncbi:MAG: ELM1/GtrOC1 family putative glycosyltransferase [Rickettsiales bacterium]|nr:ELM1/GtrOC1 family putative glycosyltransferase [Rickettsiales bacterium]
MLGWLKKKPVIWLVSDGTDNIVQSRELAKNLTKPQYIYEFTRLNANSNFEFPDIAVGVGYNIADILISLKERSKNKTKIISILDPLKNQSDFDYIILPSYEPYKINSGNIIYSRGLINYINPRFLEKVKKDKKFKFFNEFKLKPPFTTLILGGRHTGGNVSEEDVEILAERLNQIITHKGGTILISSSRRTEAKTIARLKEKLHAPFYFYDYSERKIENPYNYFLAISDEIIVTGDSVRMMCEAVSSGKKIRIFKPKMLGFQYYSLIDEFIKNNNAIDLMDKNFDTKPFSTQLINEAKRIAEIIKLSFANKKSV